MVKNLPAVRDPGFDPWVRMIPWRRDWLPTPVFLPGESHGQRIMVGYSAWGHKSRTQLSDERERCQQSGSHPGAPPSGRPVSLPW